MSNKSKRNQQRYNAFHEDPSFTENADNKQKVYELVRYLLCQDKKKIPIKRQDINKNVLKEQVRHFQPIFDDARNWLNHIFGIDVIECELSSKAKVYLLTNTLETGAEQTLPEPHGTKNSGLLMIILSLVYMSSGVLNDDLFLFFHHLIKLPYSLFKYLIVLFLYDLLKRTFKQLGIPIDSTHSQLDDISKHLQRFVKQGYIIKEKVLGSETSTYQYKLGVRSQTETSKRKILEFISEIYGIEISQWKMQYREILSEEGVHST